MSYVFVSIVSLIKTADAVLRNNACYCMPDAHRSVYLLLQGVL